jgi:hypothetical protein
MDLISEILRIKVSGSRIDKKGRCIRCKSGGVGGVVGDVGVVGGPPHPFRCSGQFDIVWPNGIVGLSSGLLVPRRESWAEGQHEAVDSGRGYPRGGDGRGEEQVEKEQTGHGALEQGRQNEECWPQHGHLGPQHCRHHLLHHEHPPHSLQRPQQRIKKTA